MTNSTSERSERLTKSYKDHLHETLKTTDDYVGYLNACHGEGPETFALAVRDVTEFVATFMRDLCLEKVLAQAEEWERLWKTDLTGDHSDKFILAQAARELADNLQSLTLDNGGADAQSNN